MAVFAVVTARNMRRILACCYRAVVATAAASQDLCVINSKSRHKRVRRMAIFADIAC